LKSRLEVECLEERQVLSAATLYNIGSGVYDLAQTFQLHSNAAAKQVVYLDFDGHTTGDVTGTSWDNLTSPAWDYSGNGPAFTDVEKQIIQKIWVRVSEDFAPFNIDVTTQDPGVEALRKVGTTDDRWGIRVVITPNDQPAPGSGGVAYVGSFNFNTDTPAYVFNVSEKAAAEAASHEAGHALGLSHDGTGTLAYYSGQGSGITSWGPIMGAAYNPTVTQWSKGQYAGANNTEDDLAKITTLNGFTYRSDDYGNTQSTAFALLPQGSSQVVSTYGLIERNTDADYFSFWSNAGSISLNVDPLNLGPNLAVRADLYSASGTLLATVNPAGALNASVNFALPTAGQYFLKVTGTGKGDPLTTGFSNYASLGNYRIAGTVQAYTGVITGNLPPVANADTATTVAGVPITINVLANDSDANGDVLTITAISNVVNGSAVLSGNSVIFTPTTGFTGVGSFTYAISDGHGGIASANASITVNAASTQPSFTNNTDVLISSTSASVVTSKINVTGQIGTIQDADVRLNIFHTWDSDLQITLIAPDGTRVTLFNRQGGSGDNLLNTTFDDASGVAITNAAAPFAGSFRPYSALSVLNGKNPNGVWTLEVRDYFYQDGGKLDAWTLNLRLGAASTLSKAEPAVTGSNSFKPIGLPTNVFSTPDHPLLTYWLNTPVKNPNALAPVVNKLNSAGLQAISHWLASHPVHGSNGLDLDFDFPAANF
jgi:subtilisin-like proprotein convertase family protein